jgi:hypothetical protein
MPALLWLQVSLWYGGEIATWFFGQGPAVAALVSRYSRWMIPGLWPMVSARQAAWQIHRIANPLHAHVPDVAGYVCQQ